MANLVRAITRDGAAVITAIRSTDLVAEAERIHKTSAVVTAALGRLLTAGAMMGYLLKGERDSLTLQLKGDGPCGTLVVVADSRGFVKGYASQPVVELPLNSYGKLDVAGAVGRNGTFCVIRDTGGKEPYVGKTPIVSGEIAEDITHYYATSEQTPTVCGLGVLVAPDLTVLQAGGFLLQLLPGAGEETIGQIERNLDGLPAVTQLLSDGVTPQDLCFRLLNGLTPELLDEADCGWRCDCSRQRVERALISLGREELLDMIAQQEPVELHCEFCGRSYTLRVDELRGLLESGQAPRA